MRKICLAVALLIFASFARAEEPQLPQPIMFVSAFLELSPAQTETLIAIIHTRDEAMRPIGESVHASHEALQKILDTENPDAVAVGQLLIDIHSGQEKAGEIAKRAAADFEATLNEEQRQKLQLVRQAEQVAPAIPAFKAAGLL